MKKLKNNRGFLMFSGGIERDHDIKRVNKLMFLSVNRTTLKQVQILLKQTHLVVHQLLKQIMGWNI